MAPNFSLGKVYVIRNTDNDKVYVGSTVRTLAQRMAQHRPACKNERKAGYPLYEAMNELGVDKFYIELLEDVPCERREQLTAAEGRYIRELKTIAPDGYNSYIAGRNFQQWCEDNREAQSVYKIAYRIANKETLNAASREYHSEHKEANNARSREYHFANKEDQNLKSRESHMANKEDRNASRREYRAAHIEAEKATKKAYYEANADDVKAKARAYQASHADEIKARKSAFRAANAEAIRAKTMQYRKDHADEIRAKDRARYASKVAAKNALLAATE